VQFHDILLPKFIAVHLKGGPAFATAMASTISGRELRIYDRQHSLQRYTLSGCRLSIDEFEKFNCFFRARMGRVYAFRVKDYADYVMNNQVIGVGDGVSTQFEIYKTYMDDVCSYTRRIYAIRDSGLIVNSKINRIDKSLGLLHTEEPVPNSEELMITAHFDVWVRFGSDEFGYSVCSDGSILIENLDLIEVVM
jgi:uncharacterized protein (TIGR02217 family)